MQQQNSNAIMEHVYQNMLDVIRIWTASMAQMR